MKKHGKHTEKQDLEKHSKNFFDHREISFPTSKDEAWNSIEARMSEDVKMPGKTFRLNTPRLLIAASLAVLLSVAAFLRFYRVSYSSGAQEIALFLPDSSRVELNPGSVLTYHPLWWRLQRNLHFEGSAEFNVSHGSKFRVVSNSGITEVLGTSFTIQSGEKVYIVTCFTGSVKVSDPITKVSAVLAANEKAELKSPGVFDIHLVKDPLEKIENVNDYLTFRQIPLQQVLKSLEDEFGVIIELPSSLDYIYTGNFKREMTIDEILSAICIPLELDYVQLSARKYRIQEASRAMD